MIKKLTTSVLCAMMIFTASAHAENSKGTINNVSTFNQEVDVISEIIVPTVQVTVPTTSCIILNPYKLPYGDDMSTDQIISQDIEITNEGTAPVEIIMDKYTTSTATTGEDGQKPRLTDRESYLNSSTTKYIYLNLSRSGSTESKNIYESSSESDKSYGSINPSESMKLVFEGGMAQNAVWTGEESVNIKPVFKILTSEITENN